MSMTTVADRFIVACSYCGKGLHSAGRQEAQSWANAHNAMHHADRKLARVAPAGGER